MTFPGTLWTRQVREARPPCTVTLSPRRTLWGLGQRQGHPGSTPKCAAGTALLASLALLRDGSMHLLPRGMGWAAGSSRDNCLGNVQDLKACAWCACVSPGFF